MSTSSAPGGPRVTSSGRSGAAADGWRQAALGVLAATLSLAGLYLTNRYALPDLTNQPRPAVTLLNYPDTDELVEMDISAVGELLASGRVSSVQLVQRYTSRIRRLDRFLKSVICLSPTALTEAAQLDSERADGKIRGPLHGIPIMLKDNINTKGMPTTAGSLALLNNQTDDAHLTALLRQAGAVILGKLNLSEWANFRSSQSTSGWSAVGGQCRNPWALDRNTSGSSSGSGVAVAASLCTAAIGTETDGSITSPATICGLVGLKPTVGLVSRSGVVPISLTQDTAGPMTISVKDTAILLSVIAGVDSSDSATARAAPHIKPNYTSFLDVNGLQGKRLGVIRNIPGFRTPVLNLFEDALTAMKDGGAVVTDVDLSLYNSDGKNILEDDEFTVLKYEFNAGICKYLKNTGPKVKVKSLADLIEFNKVHRSQELAVFHQDLLELCVEKTDLSDKEYTDALDTCRRLSRDEGIDALLKKHNLDALVMPTGNPAWLIDHFNNDNYSASASSPPAVAGYPHLTVPMGFIKGLPVGKTHSTIWP